MISKASQRSALVLLAGLGLCIAGPMRAAESDAGASDTTAAAPDKPIALSKFTKHHRTHVASAKSHKSAKSTDGKTGDKSAKPGVDADTAANTDVSGKDTLNQADANAKIPDTVANANAQWPTGPSAQTPQAAAADLLQGMNASSNASGPGAADAQPPAGSQPAAGAQIAAADQVNELDLAAAANDKPAPALTLAAATVDAPAVVTNGSTTLDRTSMIGKIFIAFGGLLTVASAARMLIA
jgi:hypothetical protein